jgi:hypothetical protein
VEYREPSVDKVSWEYTSVVLVLLDLLEMYRTEMEMDLDLDWSGFLW